MRVQVACLLFTLTAICAEDTFPTASTPDHLQTLRSENNRAKRGVGAGQYVNAWSNQPWTSGSGWYNPWSSGSRSYIPWGYGGGSASYPYYNTWTSGSGAYNPWSYGWSGVRPWNYGSYARAG